MNIQSLLIGLSIALIATPPSVQKPVGHYSLA